jgi:FixJ family two-component response regulator
VGIDKVERLIGVVEDDESVRTAMDSLIRAAGYGTRLFASAEEFLNSSERHEIECLIIDIQLPGVSGLELQARLAREDYEAPIIIISSHDPELRARALEKGAVAELAKPFNPASLLGAIESALEPGR